MTDDNAASGDFTCLSPATASPEAASTLPDGPDPPRVGRTPTDEECFRLWEAYEMLPHIREHSLTVAKVAAFLAENAKRAGLDLDVQEVRASALLHDLAKTYTIYYGGNHSQLGGAWVQELTGNPLLAQGVTHHVHWPGELDARKHFLPLAVIYSDKRVKHNRVVTLGERFEDLLERYGATDYIRGRIERSFRQARQIEAALSELTGLDLAAQDFSFAEKR